MAYNRFVGDPRDTINLGRPWPADDFAKAKRWRAKAIAGGYWPGSEELLFRRIYASEVIDPVTEPEVEPKR